MSEHQTDLPARITKQASKQTYYTIRFLMDRDRRQDAYRAYAYFRWMDDQIDAKSGTQQEKKAFLDQQCMLLEACYRRESPTNPRTEEQMLVDLVVNDQEKDSGLQCYLRNMMGVMMFDVERCGRIISHKELSQYSQMLSKAVTEYMFYFIGHNDPCPYLPGRYQAVYGAHVVHMLRDMADDIALGYFNIPGEVLEAEGISLSDLRSRSFRMWVMERVKLAHRNIETGRKYIARVKNLRCRMAGFAYLARFEWVLNKIIRDKYYLRSTYKERKSFSAGLWMGWRLFTSLINLPWMKFEPEEQVVLPEQFEE